MAISYSLRPPGRKAQLSWHLKINSESPFPPAIAHSCSASDESPREPSRLLSIGAKPGSSACFEPAAGVGIEQGTQTQARVPRERIVFGGSSTTGARRSEHIAATKPTTQTSKEYLTSSCISSSSDSSDQSSDTREGSCTRPSLDMPSCEEELEAVWQALKSGIRGIELARLPIHAMNITAQRAADKVKAQNAFVGKAGRQRTIAEFRAGKYLRCVRSLMKEVESTVGMLVKEEPKLLKAICAEKKQKAVQLKKKVRSSTRRSRA